MFYVISFGLGIIEGYLICYSKCLKKNKEISKLEAKLSEKDEKINKLIDENASNYELCDEYHQKNAELEFKLAKEKVNSSYYKKITEELKKLNEQDVMLDEELMDPESEVSFKDIDKEKKAIKIKSDILEKIIENANKKTTQNCSNQLPNQDLQF